MPYGVITGAFILAALALVLFAAYKIDAEDFTVNFGRFGIHIRNPRKRRRDDEGDPPQSLEQ